MTNAPDGLGARDRPDGPDGPNGPDGSDGSDGSDEEYYPEFRTVRRGYDPDEVEQVLDDLYTSLNDAVRDAEEHARRRVAAERDQRTLRSALADAQRRVAELESRRVQDAKAFEGVGTRVDEILRAAAVEASEIVARAQEQAQARARESEKAAIADRAETERLRDQARAEAAALRNEATEYRARVRTQLAQVRERLTAALDAGAVQSGPTGVDDGVRD